MKTFRLFVMVIGMLTLVACGDDSSGGGGGHTGNKADFSSGKKLVEEYKNTQHFEKGHMDYNKVRQNLSELQRYVSMGRQLTEIPQKYFAMRHVGCLAGDGSGFVSEQNRHTQMDYVIGANSNRVTYVQQNSIDGCGFAGVNIGGGLSLGGIITGAINKNLVARTSTKHCSEYAVEGAFVRIEKERLGYSSKNKDNDYWNYRYRWTPEKDFYYQVSHNWMGRFDQSTVVGNSEDDSFGTLSNGEAVFVTKSLKNRSSNPSCEKDVYWGYEFDINNPPQIQILGRN